MVLPLADNNRARRTLPWSTYLLIAVNVAAFTSLAFADPARRATVFDSYALVPSHVLHGGPSAWLTLATCTFLHASWAHLAGNMLFLWIFGDNVEDAFGHLRYLVFYLLGGVLASVTQLLIDPASTAPVVGASGAIAAVLAAYVVLFPRGRVRTLVVLVPPFFVWPVLPAWLLIGGWFALQFWSGLQSLGTLATGTVAYWAHVGGFVVGLVLARPMARDDGVERRLARADRFAEHRGETARRSSPPRPRL